MNSASSFSVAGNASPHPVKLSRDTVFLIGDLLPLLDFAGVLLAAYLGTLLYANWVLPGAAAAVILDGGGRAALAAAVLAPFILCDRTFVSFASGGQTASLIRCYTVRFLMFAGAVALIGLASRSLASLPRGWLALCFATTLGVTAITRLLLVGTLRHLERKGILRETIAVVGAGPHTDRLIRELRQARCNTVEILGPFDDPVGIREDGATAPAGSIAELIELGKSRPLDWILLALPAADHGRLPVLVHRLKALAVPVGLCSPDTGPGLPLAASRPGASWSILLAGLETVLPRWILTLLSLPLAALRLLFVALRNGVGVRRRAAAPLSCPLDDYDLGRFTRVAAHFGQDRFGFVVTPNADHLIRLHQDAAFRALYADAAYILLDSRFVANLLRFTRKLALPVCTGGDLTARLFGEIVTPDDGLVLIGGSARQAACLAERYGLKRLAHFNPPMDFIHDPAAVEACLRFVEAHSPFRYCLLAVGSPQQEFIAQRLKARGIARGLALCVGASIDYLTGEERRAPGWMQRAGMEWLFRLLQAPGRMAWRYFVRGPQLFGLLRRTEIVLRPPVSLAPTTVARTAAPSRLTAARSRRRPLRAARAQPGATGGADRRIPAPAMNESAPGP